MRRSWLTVFAATLLFGAAGAYAQDGDLSSVTMRVLDDVGDIRAVILDLDASRGEGEEDAARGGAPRADEASSADRSAADSEDSEDDERHAREALHEPDDDERGEGKLEDNDVESPAAATTP